MKKENRRSFVVAAGMLTAFVLWTAAVRLVDVGAIGPRGSTVGFATINRYVHNLAGVHMSLYTISDWLGLVPVAFAMGFGLLGLIQWIKRKSFVKVDFSILVLGGFYIAVMAVYILFEMVVVNYRPVLIEGYLEASYPSSTTLLVTCVIPTAIMQFNARIRNNIFRRCVAVVLLVFITFMVVVRLISGVHWITDIIGGLLLSTGLVMMYRWVISLKQK